MLKGPSYCSGPDYRVLPAFMIQGQAMCGQLVYKHAQVTDACGSVTGDMLLGCKMTSRMWSGVESGFSLVPRKLMNRTFHYKVSHAPDTGTGPVSCLSVISCWLGENGLRPARDSTASSRGIWIGTSSIYSAVPVVTQPGTASRLHQEPTRRF